MQHEDNVRKACSSQRILCACLAWVDFGGLLPCARVVPEDMFGAVKSWPLDSSHGRFCLPVVDWMWTLDRSSDCYDLLLFIMQRAVIINEMRMMYIDATKNRHSSHC